ncbi:hypothetical protein V5F34_00775 [Xanthobacter autotrophicus]|uniref:hypothetical protein n=1 Tax=Xanthobacter autotrophicus TaxID=280 RepID=UPI0037295A39
MSDDFNTGYVIACANLVHLHDEPSMAADMMSQLGISWADVLRMGLSDYDMDVLRKIREEKPIHPFFDTNDTSHDRD